MYQPRYTIKEDHGAILDIVSKYPLATVMAFTESHQPYFSHIPLIARDTTPEIVLYGHVAKQNRQWSHFEKNSESLVIFHGPNCYVTPSWYASGRDVPTWAYVVIHMKGKVRTVHAGDELVHFLKISSKKFEEDRSQPWEFELPPDLSSPQILSQAIVGYEITIADIQAKFKLGQSRSPKDKQGVINGLSAQGSDMSLQIRDLMQRELK